MDFVRKVGRAWLRGFVLLGIGFPALATDGVLEINQSCAVSTGCFSGDSPGFPVTIDGSAGRSYRLTSDLVVPDVNTDGISITTHDIGVDLNNFTIIGVACVGATTTSCRPLGGTGTGSGIEVDSLSTRFGVSVANGSIVGMGRRGVSLGYEAEVRNLRVRWNGAHGVFVPTGSTVSGVTARQNVGDGIAATDGCTISGSASFANGGNGITAGAGSTVTGNSVRINVGHGILAAGGSTISGNSITSNSGAGLVCADDLQMCGYVGNTFSGNQGGSVTGTELRATGGNACNDGLCASGRRYYLTTDQHRGNEALGACASGYHMASRWEIRDPTSLYFASELSDRSATDDYGSGPSIKLGWARTGSNFYKSPTAGWANCGSWTSGASSDFGTIARLWPTDPAGTDLDELRIAPWQVGYTQCSNTYPVWCIQD